MIFAGSDKWHGKDFFSKSLGKKIYQILDVEILENGTHV